MSDHEEWWELLDWSGMESIFKAMSMAMKDKVLDRGYWSKGKGIFKKEKND